MLRSECQALDQLETPVTISPSKRFRAKAFRASSQCVSGQPLPPQEPKSCQQKSKNKKDGERLLEHLMVSSF